MSFITEENILSMLILGKEQFIEHIVKDTDNSGVASIRFVAKTGALSNGVTIVADILKDDTQQGDAKYFVAAVNGAS